MALPAGTRLGPYEILAPLGAGGMGEVYRARDSRLGREVAVKVLGSEAADRDALERFRREAQLLAAVTHPNVCQIFDLGVHDGAPFLAMELLSGEPLSARLAVSGALPQPEAVRVARDLLAALGELHRRGIVHRDLKPSNVYLTPHGTKLLDLGVARKVGGASDAPTLTRTGTALGTPHYMAPEQWSGSAEPRSDIFACGAVLFEMLTGRMAFPGDTALEILNGVLRGAPPSLGAAASDALDRVLRRALAGRPEDRYSSAAEMAEALAAALDPSGPRSALPARAKRLLVLPLRLLRPDPEIDFLALALADAVSASLAGLTHLVVRSSRVLRAPDEDPARLAAEAGVDALLYGTLLRAGERVRVSTQLVEAASGTVVCSNTAEATLRDLFDLQDDLARQVVEALRVPLAPEDAQALRHTRPPDPRAYELYLRATGASLSTSRTRSLRQARDLLRESVDIDPSLAPAWAQLGRMHRLLAKYGHEERDQNVRAAQQAFETALALDPDSPQTHHLYTSFEIEELGSPVQAMLRLLRRVGTHRTDAALYAGLVAACRYTGLFEASLAAHARARALDPQIRTGAPFTYWMMGDYERALELDDEPVAFVRHYALPMLGRDEEAIAGYEDWKTRLEGGLEVLMGEEMIAALRGDRAACVAAAERMVALGFRDAEGLYFQARCLAKVGAIGEAISTLERVVASGFTCPVTMLKDPWLEPVRGETGFTTVVKHAVAANRHAADSFVRARGHQLLGLDSSQTSLL